MMIGIMVEFCLELMSSVNIFRCHQCCGSETFHYGSGSDFSLSSGSGSYFKKVPVSHATFFLTKYDFKGLKMAFQNIIFREYLNLVYQKGHNYEITPFLTVFVDVSIRFRIWIWIRNPRDTDPAKVPDPCGSGSTTLVVTTYFLLLNLYRNKEEICSAPGLFIETLFFSARPSEVCLTRALKYSMSAECGQAPAVGTGRPIRVRERAEKNMGRPPLAKKVAKREEIIRYLPVYL
jgi:hypothetical protein